ncbi:Lon protease [Madurella mycetomatis]|uniref:Lon protease n=1 Tax=Madurella mycetomatis TaxID=100816 RepID=A0A175WBH4_9PEZI|nr:Lon protease [Madurella mycetomatis]
MNPIQLAKKRANDREAQRNIRQRNKELISRLTERNAYLTEQLETKESQVQQLLLQRNTLERELAELREAVSLPPDRPCQPSGFEIDGLPAAGPSPVVSRPPSFRGSTEYNATSTSPFGASYLPTPESCDSWSSVMPMSSAITIPSAVSSPGSTAGHPEDYGQGFIATSVPPSMINGAVISSTPLPYRLHTTKMGYGELDTGKTRTKHGLDAIVFH